MSRNFVAIPSVPWIGIPQSVNVSLCKPIDAPRAQVVNIDFADPRYPAGTKAILVDLKMQGASRPLDRIVSLKIDNTGNNASVYVQFPDASDIITVLPFSIVLTPVFTNDLVFVVYCLSGAPLLRIHASNVYIEPGSESEMSLDIPLGATTQGAATGKGVSQWALGDVALEIVSLDLTNPANNVPVFTGYPLHGYIIMTDIQARIYNLTALPGSLTFGGSIVIKGLVSGTIYRTWNYLGSFDFPADPNGVLIDQMHNGQLVLPRTDNLIITQITNTFMNSGRFDLKIAYTWTDILQVQTVG